MLYLLGMKFLKRIRLFVIYSFIFSIVYIPNTGYAAWSGSAYSPGETLNPECAPTDSGCTVSLSFTASSGNIGIGSTTPWGKLSVNPNGITGPSFVIGSSTGTSFLVTNGGMVGIGTYTPTYVLEAKAPSSVSSLFKIQNSDYNNTDTGTALTMITGASSGNSYVRLQVLNGGGSTSGNMVLNSSGGNVGVGTTSPYAKLSVTNTSTNPSFIVEDSTSPDTTPFIIDTSGNVGIGTSSPFATLAINPTAGNASNQFVVGSSTATSFVIDNSGNVGIGTTTTAVAGVSSSLLNVGTSTSIFSVSGSNGAVVKINAGGTIGGLGSSNLFTPLQVYSLADTGYTSYVAEFGPANISGSTAAYNSLAAFNERAVFGYEGRDRGGISTGYVLISDPGPSNVKSIAFRNGSGNYINLFLTTTSRVGIGGNVTSPSATMEIVSTSTIPILRLTSYGGTSGSVLTAGHSGLVGTGTTTPYAKLSISGTDVATSTFAIRPIASQTANIADIYTSAGVLKDVISSANLWGLGTSSPSSKLSITQTTNTPAGGLWIAETGNTDFRSIYMSDTSGTLSFFGGDTAGALNTATLSSAGTWTNASDRSYKENIVNLDTKYNLNTLLSIQPRFYTMKGSGKPQIGFIAQELQPILPEVVEGTEGSLGISYGNMVALLVQAIKDINTKVDNIANKLSGVFKTDSVEANKVSTKELCVDDVCVSKEQFREMVVRSGVMPNIIHTNENNNTNQSSAINTPNTDNGTSTPQVENNATTTQVIENTATTTQVIENNTNNQNPAPAEQTIDQNSNSSPIENQNTPTE